MSITDLFYRRLIKSSLNLDERARVAACLASCAREERSSKWFSIASRLNLYEEALSFLHDYGYLKIKLQNQADLVSQIKTLASSHSNQTSF